MPEWRTLERRPILQHSTPGTKIRHRWQSWHISVPLLRRTEDHVTHQEWAKVWFPVSVNVWRKSCVLLPTAGRRTQLFHLIFMEPGNHTLAHPCTVSLFWDALLHVSGFRIHNMAWVNYESTSDVYLWKYFAAIIYHLDEPSKTLQSRVSGRVGNKAIDFWNSPPHG